MAGVSQQGIFASREARAPGIPAAVCQERATTREAKRTVARRVAPKMAWGFVAPQSQIAADMLLRRASPQGHFGRNETPAICETPHQGALAIHLAGRAYTSISCQQLSTLWLLPLV